MSIDFKSRKNFDALGFDLDELFCLGRCITTAECCADINLFYKTVMMS